MPFFKYLLIYCRFSPHIHVSLFIIYISQILLYLFSGKLYLENIYLVKEFGITIEKHFFNGSIQKNFIPRYKVREVIINEALTLWDVKVYLALLVQGENELIMLFGSFGLETKKLLMGYEVIKEHLLK